MKSSRRIVYTRRRWIRPYGRALPGEGPESIKKAMKKASARSMPRRR